MLITHDRWTPLLNHAVPPRLLIALLASATSSGVANDCKTARVVSEGFKNLTHVGHADFYLNDERVSFGTSRGLNVVTIDPGTQEVISKRTYDTWRHRWTEDRRLATDLSALRHGQIVLVSIMDDGMELLDPAAKDALRSVGARDLDEGFREGYALIGSKGGAAVAEGRGLAGEVNVSGKLPCATCITAKVVSNSGADGKPAEFFLDGKACDVATGTGLNVLFVDRVTQKFKDFKRYLPQSRLHVAMSTGANFAADMDSLPEGTIVLVAAWPWSATLLDDAAQMALQWHGAQALGDIADGGSFAFIGSKDGWSIADASNSNGSAVAEGRLPCVLEDTTPKELPDPQAPFPGMSIAESNAAWPSGRQPKPFEAWSKSAAGRLRPCWKTRVLRDNASGSLGNCHGLKPTDEQTLEACKSSCARRLDCTVWQFSSHQRCLQGSSMDCDHPGQGHLVDLHQGEQQLQHGDVRVLRPLLAVQVLGLRQLGKLSDPSFDAVIRCRDWCYSNVNCQYWQFGEGGCFVEDPQNGAVAEYPLTLKGGARDDGKLARSMLAGEYIQHFCPPRPLGFQEGRRQVAYVEGAAIFWNGSLVMGRRGEAPWAPQHEGAPLPAWPEGPEGTPLPCLKTRVLRQGKGVMGGWHSGCMEFVNLSSLHGASCRDVCLFNASCSSWAVVGTGRREACYNGAGVSCSNVTQRQWRSAAQWSGELIQHGEVQVLKDISHVEIYNLHSLGSCRGVGEGECVDRCRAWCFSNVRCRYWQYSSRGCSVDAVGVGAPAYASGLAGALSSSSMGLPLLAGEYVRHFCWRHDTLQDVTNVEGFRTLLTARPSAVAVVMSRAQDLLARGRDFAAQDKDLEKQVGIGLLALVSLGFLLCCLARCANQKQDQRDLKFRWCGGKNPYAYDPCPCIQEEGSGAWHPPKSKRVVVVLEKAPLEGALGARGEELHTALECLQALLSSALAKAGRLQVFLHSPKDALVEVHPSLLPPATLGEFRRLLSAVLVEGEVRGEPGDFQPRGLLMRTLLPPVERYLPSVRTCAALSAKGRRASLDELAEAAAAAKRTMVFAVGVSPGDAVREPGFGAAYAPDAVAICPFSVGPVEVCKLVCQGLVPYMGVHDPPLEADCVEAPLVLDTRRGPGAQRPSRKA